MKITIGAYDQATGKVPVTFEDGDRLHDREVNACHDDAGAYDAEATAVRVDAVALGVAVKMGLGVLGTIAADGVN